MSPNSSPRLSLLICLIYASTKSACSFITNTVNLQLQPPTVTTTKPRSSTGMMIYSMPSSNDCLADDKNPFHLGKKITNKLGKATLIALTSATLIASPIVSFADEIGREVEAPTLFTGESVEICIKRGPLGACQKTEIRTEDNDNDKATKYFKGKDKTILAGGAADDKEVESDLLKGLRQKTEDNREKNEQAVKIKTFENNQAANFGPFDRQVVILNTDGKTFTLLQNPQAMRLKKAGYIEGRKFVKQPSAEVLEGALESEEGFGDFVKGFFGDK